MGSKHALKFLKQTSPIKSLKCGISKFETVHLAENHTDVAWWGQWNLRRVWKCLCHKELSSRSSSPQLSRSTQFLQPLVWRRGERQQGVAHLTSCKRKWYLFLTLEGILMRSLGDQGTNWHTSSHFTTCLHSNFYFDLSQVSLVKMQKSVCRCHWAEICSKIAFNFCSQLQGTAEVK